MKKVAITGLSGVVGMRFLKNLPDCEIYDLYHRQKASSENVTHNHIELLNSKSIINTFKKINPEIIVHMASITHIDRCEEDQKNGQEGKVWKVNVGSADIISKFCKKNGTKLIFLSTECVFDGSEQSYDEKSTKNPINWYGKTKSEAEDVIIANCPDASIIRAVIAYHEQDQEKTLFGKMLKLLESGKNFGAVTDQFITPTYTDDIIKTINSLINNTKSGIFHISSGEKTTIYDFANKMASKFGFNQSIIVKQTLEEFFGEGRARLRLKNSCLNGEWTKSRLNIVPSTVDEVLDKINL